jgi:uncharacterized protein with NAD-binding domain and iron-sulfur cluster
MLRCFSLLKTLTLSVVGSPAADVPGGARPDERSTVDETRNLNFSADAATSLALLIARASKLLRAGALTGSAALLQGVTMLERWLQEMNFGPQSAASAMQLMEAVTAQLRKLLKDVVSVDPAIRTRTQIIDILLTIMVGLFRDRVLFSDKGLDSINDFDYREWLLHHGGTDSSVNSSFVRGAYDLVFAYEDGDKSKPRLAAGVALRGALRMFFTYRGSMFWRLRSGMGDAVFAPLYRVLQLKGRVAGPAPERMSPVTFHFLHELTAVRMETSNGQGDRKVSVSELVFTVRGDEGEIDRASAHALDANGCWPDKPQFGAAPEAAPSFRAWKRGDHFDGVVLALGIDDFKIACAEPLSDHTLPVSWTRMCSQVKTVATQAAQVWLKKGLEDLGWYRGSGLFTGLGLSFDTWADMTHTLAAERATPGRQEGELDKARSVAYFCAPLQEEKVRKAGGNTAALNTGVGDSLTTLLKSELRPIWPNAYTPRATAANLQIVRHVKANFAGSERYTLSLPGSISARVSPLDRTVENMTIAGDWTACGLDAGCIEAAVMSGMLAAYAISGQPDPATIIGYDHP